MAPHGPDSGGNETRRSLGPVAAARDERGGTEDQLVRSHLPLVRCMVAEMASRLPRHVRRDELVSAGMAGLAQAARTFDPSRGVSFQRFASSRLRGAVLDELRARDWASRSVRAKARDIFQVADQLTAKLARQPTPEEVALAVGATKDGVQAVNTDVYRAVIVNFEALAVDGDAEEVLPPGHSLPEEDMLENEKRAYLVAAVDHLPARLRRVIIGYFFEELPMQVLADELGVTSSRISQMRAAALLLLKDAINSQLDPDLVATGEPGRVAKRRHAYFAAVAAHDDYRRRLGPGAGRLAILSRRRDLAAPA